MDSSSGGDRGRGGGAGPPGRRGSEDWELCGEEPCGLGTRLESVASSVIHTVSSGPRMLVQMEIFSWRIREGYLAHRMMLSLKLVEILHWQRILDGSGSFSVECNAGSDIHTPPLFLLLL